jgi:hypothetical protein
MVVTRLPSIDAEDPARSRLKARFVPFDVTGRRFGMIAQAGI